MKISDTPMHKSRESGESAIDTLTAFVCDVEHDLFATLTTLQAHIDLFYDEFALRDSAACQFDRFDRFAIMNRAVARVVADTTALASISELSGRKRSIQPQMLEPLMHEIAAESRPVFALSHVALSYDIERGTLLIGSAVSVKTLLTAMLITMLRECIPLETIRVVGRTDNDSVCLSFQTTIQPDTRVYTPWKLGELRLFPTDGGALGLSAVDAMARLLNGSLSLSDSLSESEDGDPMAHRQFYRLTFKNCIRS